MYKCTHTHNSCGGRKNVLLQLLPKPTDLKSGRKWRFACIDMIMWSAQWVNNEWENDTRRELWSYLASLTVLTHWLNHLTEHLDAHDGIRFYLIVYS